MYQSILQAALSYARMGYALIPLRGKVPLTKHGVYDAISDPDQLRKKLRPGCNIGVILTDALVIDVDPRNGGNVVNLALKAEDCGPVVISGGGGLHFWFRKPEIPVKSHPIEGIDVLTGKNKSIIVPPSRNGRVYEWVQPLQTPDQLPALPEQLLEQIIQPEILHNQHQYRVSQTSQGRFEEICTALQKVDPYLSNYMWWVRMVAAIHSEFPGEDGLALAEAWADGKPGELARMWRSFSRRSGGNCATAATIFYFANHFG